MWHQPCQRCKYVTSVDIQKTRYKKLVESHASAVSLLESGELPLYKSNHHHHHHHPHTLLGKSNPAGWLVAEAAETEVPGEAGAAMAEMAELGVCGARGRGCRRRSVAHAINSLSHY